MKAIILASGIGSRLMPLTESIPKCLARLNGKTILDFQIEFLVNCGIKKIIITTGHLEEKIKEHMKAKYPDIEAVYVYNPEYRNTNYIYSLWLAKDFIDDDALLLHSDLVFDESLLKRAIMSSSDCVLVNNKIKPPEKDFKALVENGMVKKIGVKVFGPNAFFCLPLYKCSRNYFMAWFSAMEEMIKKGGLKCYAEDAFNEFSGKLELRPVYFGDEFGMEIDDFEDLEKARRHFAKIKA